MAWSIAYPSTTVRYRMTVSVETPEGIKTGSAVREVTIERHPQLLGETSVGSVGVRGEAITVDLGKRGVLFALMSGGVGGVDYGAYILTTAFPVRGGPVTREGIGYYRSLKTGKVTLKPGQYPMFVRFKDSSDPKTVESIYREEPYDALNEKGQYTGRAYHITDRFEETFGKGVKLKEVTIEITDEPVTTGVEKIIPSFGQGTGFNEWQRSLRYGDPLYLDRTEFIRR